MNNEIGSLFDKILGRSSGRRIFMFGIMCILIATIINSYEKSPTAIALAVLGLFMMIRGYSDYSAELNKEPKSDEE
jgi:cell shape-determining protein MreD